MPNVALSSATAAAQPPVSVILTFIRSSVGPDDPSCVAVAAFTRTTTLPAEAAASYDTSQLRNGWRRCRPPTLRTG
jgi:hypothetical protein